MTATVEKRRSIGEINNGCGGLLVKSEDGKCYWGIEDWTSGEADWKEIPESLYRALNEFEDSREV